MRPPFVVISRAKKKIARHEPRKKSDQSVPLFVASARAYRINYIIVDPSLRVYPHEVHDNIWHATHHPHTSTNYKNCIHVQYVCLHDTKITNAAIMKDLEKIQFVNDSRNQFFPKTVLARYCRLREFQSKFYSRKVNDYKNGAQFFSSFKLSSVIISRSPGVSTAVRQLFSG